MLVQSLVEEDDPSDAAVDAIVSTEEDLTVLPAVFLRVLHSNLGQPLRHAPCSTDNNYRLVLTELESRASVVNESQPLVILAQVS